MVYGQGENQERPTRTEAFISLLLDRHKELEKHFIVLEELLRERTILREVPVEKVNGKPDLGLGHLLRRHNRSWSAGMSTTPKHGVTRWQYGPIVLLEG